MQDTLNQIARDTLRIETLKTRNSDSLDYHDLAVWEIRTALQNAYTAGSMAAGLKTYDQKQLLLNALKRMRFQFPPSRNLLHSPKCSCHICQADKAIKECDA